MNIYSKAAIISLKQFCMKDSLFSLNTNTAAAATNEEIKSSYQKIALSATQQYLLQVQAANPLCSAHNEGVVVELDKATNLGKLYDAFAGLMQVNHQLATVYDYAGGTPFGTTIPCIPDFIVTECKHGSREALAKAINAEYNTAFDLSVSCMRIRVYITGEEAPVMLVMIHPIACEGWSRKQFWEELVQQYSGKTDAPAASRPDYAAFVQKEAAYLKSQEAQEAAGFWNATLSSGAQHIKASFQSNKALSVNCRGELKIPINYDKVAAIGTQAGNDTGIFETLFSIYQHTIACYTGQQHIFTGTQSLSRSCRFREFGGYFVKPLAIPGHINYNLTFLEQLQHNRAFIQESKKYSDYPFSCISTEASQSNNRREYFSYFFSLRNRLFDLPSRPGNGRDATSDLCYRVLDILKKTDARYLLHMEVTGHKAMMAAVFHYNTSVISEKDIQHISNRFLVMLDAIAANPGITLSSLLLSQPATGGFSKKMAEEVRTDDCIAGRGYSAQFALQAKKYAGAGAVRDSAGKWSYKELDEQANTVCTNLNHYFEAAQINNTGKKIVAVAIERSRELAAIAIGTWKAGYVYMPVDPSLPSSLIQHILEDAGALLFITGNIIPDLSVSQVLSTPFFNKPKKSGAQQLPPAHSGVDGSYIMYTSQQSGGLNGVIINQQAMLQHIHTKIDDLELNENSRVAQTASQSCDVSVWQMFAPLLCGAEVRFYNSNEMLASDEFTALLDAEAITAIQVMPDALAAFANAVEAKMPPLKALEYVVTTGEEQSDSHLFQWLRQYPHIRLANCYGPALNDGNAKIGKENKTAKYPQVPVCRAMANMQLFMVDEYGRLCTPDDAGDEAWAGIADYLDAEEGLEDGSGFISAAGSSEQTPLLFTFSSGTMEGLNMHIKNMAKFIKENQAISLNDLCYTLGRERIHYGCRKSFAANSKESLLVQMDDYISQKQEKNELNTPVNPVLIFSGADTLTYETVELWCRSDAYFKEIYRYYLERITVGMERTAPSIYRFVFQIAYYDYLKHHGIAATRISGVEAGQLTAAVTENIVTLEEGASKIEFEKTAALSTDEMTATVEKLIAVHTRTQKPVFIDMGLNSWVTGALEKHPMNGSSYLLFDRNVQSPAQTVALLQSLLYDNNIENPVKFFNCLNGQSVELPFRKFTRSQWRKDEPK
jgi:non-ribosomal peptide synthetase component F